MLRNRERENMKRNKGEPKRLLIDIEMNMETIGEYFGCYIPLERRSVPAKDKVNTVSMYIDNDGNVSQMQTLVARVGGSDYTQEEYRARYCQKRNGKYYFIGNHF
jgi:hypothetical protein